MSMKPDVSIDNFSLPRLQEMVYQYSRNRCHDDLRSDDHYQHLLKLVAARELEMAGQSVYT